MDPSKSIKPGEEQLKEVSALKTEIDFNKEGHGLLTCPKCKHFISGEDINIEKTVAKCSHCHHVFGFAYDSTTASLVPEVIVPQGVEELKLKSELDIRLKWLQTTSKGGRWFLILFTTMWNLILLPFVVGVIISGLWGILLFLSAHLLIGLGLLWHLATVYFNQTSISVSEHGIKIRTMPLLHPLWKNKDIDTNSLKQLYVSRYVASTSNGVPNYAYALYAILNTGEKISLIRGMNRETQVYIERAIEDYLGIRNTKVSEED